MITCYYRERIYDVQRRFDLDLGLALAREQGDPLVQLTIDGRTVLMDPITGLRFVQAVEKMADQLRSAHRAASSSRS
jgi:hypothetical protein